MEKTFTGKENIMNIGNLFGEMKKVDYKGAYIIELYRKNFENTEELKTSFDFLKRF